MLRAAQGSPRKPLYSRGVVPPDTRLPRG